MISNIRTTLIEFAGQRATHALQDGFTMGVLFTLTTVRPEVASVVFGAIGIDGATKKKRLAKAADTLMRTEQIQENPEYFLIGFGIGAGYGMLNAAQKILEYLSL